MKGIGTCVLLGAVLAALPGGPALAQQNNAVHPVALNSYLQPPFVYADKPGAAEGFVRLLNEQLTPEFQLVLENVPRSRMTEAYLSRADFRGVALFLSPNFVAPEINSRVHWSRPILADENVLVTAHMASPKSWADLKGKTFGGIQGHIYKPLAALFERGDLRREDAHDHQSNLGRLCLGRVDVIIMSRSEYRSADVPTQCAQGLSAATMPEPDVFFRRVLVSGPESFVASVLRAVDTVACGPVWHGEALARKLSTVPCQESTH